MTGVLDAILAWDRRWFLLINAIDFPGWVYIAGIGTDLGLGLVLTLLLLAGLRVFDPYRFPKNFIVLGLAIAMAGIVNAGVKSTVSRARPLGDATFRALPTDIKEQAFNFGIDVRSYALDSDDEAFADRRLRVIGDAYKRRSFPSGHTAASFAVAAGLIYAFRSRRRWLWLVPAAFVGLTRVAVGAHFPLDVIFGAFVGFGTAGAGLRAFEIFHGLGSRPETYPLPARASGAPPRVMMVAGEASADVYGARVVEEMKKAAPDVRAFGVGGDAMRRAGFDVIADAHELSIVGFTAVLTSLGAIVRIYMRLVRELVARPPDALVCIDLPDFNLMLATQARRRSIPVVFYISPQFWAWRSGRVHGMRESVTRMIVAFGFEEPYYRDARVPVSFHGHPILEVLRRRHATREEALSHFGLDPRRRTLVLAPGSRRNEFKYVRAAMFEAGTRILREMPDWQAAVPIAPRADEDEMRAAANAAGLSATFTRGDNFDLFAAADFGIMCSGTATLEAAVAELPQVIVYRGHPLNILIARTLVNIDRIGLPNIVLGGDTPTFPELVQEDATAGPLAARVLAILKDENECERLRAACRRVRQALRAGETSQNVAREVLELARTR
ncbi:lipid-A-disaccharide synthase [bacterium]|nr:lipid-A-disaccharide synthase [bacterium]